LYQGGYIFYAGASLAGAGYTAGSVAGGRPSYHSVQLWQG